LNEAIFRDKLTYYMEEYNPQKIEPKWQKYWDKEKIFQTDNSPEKQKFYCLDMFPYPSGAGLHVGHPRGYIATDIIFRQKLMKGLNALHPMGWDAFGLPAENYAIKTGIHPEISTDQNIERFKKQIKSIGLVYDWSREINTTNPEYYKWTQWIFLLLFKKGLAYQADLPINWCPSCKTGLANEEVVGGKCERCGTEVTKKQLKQWVLRITKYADRLLEDLEGLDWPEKIITMQKNWIGKSYGTEIDFKLENSEEIIKVFTTRADTIFGVTALVIAPEHPLVLKLIKKENEDNVKKYIEESKKKNEFERTKLEKEKTGVFTGSYCINPINKEKVPIWIGDYVVATYGGGAVMMVPAHDKRDFAFAKEYEIEIKEVISGGDISKEAFVDYGFLINSEEFNGLNSEEAIEKISDWLEKNKVGKKTIQYKLRDWIFSRQRYWGEPIPLVHCSKCGVVPVSEKDLPLKLPKIENYQPTGTGESPLASISDWVNTKCPKCSGPAKRETNTMPQWAGSCWYFIRYIDPKNNKEFLNKEKGKDWLPVDLYVGGAEHAVLHLLYSRFWIKVLYDEGLINFKEPFIKLRNQGIILANDGQKMSKSRGNVINPDDIIKQYGADTLRLYEMFMGPFEDKIVWDIKGIEGCFRFLKRIYKFILENSENKKNEDSKENTQLLNKLINKITEDIKNMKFNTAVSSFMEFLNNIETQKGLISKKFIENILILLSPFVPHVSEELWQKFGHKESIVKQKWPEFDAELVKDETKTLIIQINGKIRDEVEIPTNITEQEASKLTLNREKVKRWLDGKQVKKTIFVPGKLINLVI